MKRNSQLKNSSKYSMALGLKPLQFTAILVMLSALVQTEALKNSRNLDENPPDFQNKCGSCPCNSPCNYQSPPPPPPPKIHKPPPTNYCPPPPGYQYPPSSPYIYFNGPPGSLYPVDPFDYSGSSRSFSLGIIPFLLSSIIVSFMLNTN